MSGREVSGDEAGAHAAGARKLARRPLNEDVFFAAASVAFSTDSAASAEIFLLAFLDVVFFVFFGFAAERAGRVQHRPSKHRTHERLIQDHSRAERVESVIRNVFAPQRDLLSHDHAAAGRERREREDAHLVSSLHDVSVRRALVRLIARDVQVRALIQEERERPHGQTEHLWRVVALFLCNLRRGCQ